MASNGQGIWIGYDDTGAMVLQLELANNEGMETGGQVSATFDVNGRYYRSVPASIVSEDLAVVQGADVEALLGRLMSGRTLAVTIGNNVTETHLRGSSAAIREVRNEAALQARLFESGRIDVTEQPSTEQTPTIADEDVTLYYLPGVQGYGVADVRFDLQEGRGLVIFMNFEAIEGHEDPRHSISMTVAETERAIELIRKGEAWTDIAKANRVGLFSKRIGYIDNIAVNDETSDSDASAGAPKDYRAVNFNSYENGETGVQIEHSVGGFSRRFNLTIDEAMELADFLENTLEVRSQQFETREMSDQEKEDLFQ